jgi:hypothetical protein
MELPSSKTNRVDQVSIVDGKLDQCYEIVDALRRKLQKIPAMGSVINKLRPVPIWTLIGRDTNSDYYTDSNSLQIDSSGLLNLTMKQSYFKPENSDDGYRFTERRAGVSLDCQNHTYAVTGLGLFNKNNEIVHIYGMNGEFESSKIVFVKTTEDDGALHSLTTHCEALMAMTKQRSSSPD